MDDYIQDECISAYSLKEPIGSGQFGKVYRAVHKATKEEFAIKVVKSQ